MNEKDLFSMPIIDEKISFWMIRAKRGFFFDEFVNEEFIAIGWNSIKKSMISTKMKKPQSDIIKDSISLDYGESKPGTALNKCIRFCYEIKKGDIAVIVDNGRMAFAYIGDYYEESSSIYTVDLEKETHKKIEKANLNTEGFACPYVKRRKIQIIKILGNNDTISPYLQNAIARNWHSLSGLNDYAETVLSGCFDTFVFKEKLTLTFRVKQKNDINIIDLSNFGLCAAKMLSDDNLEKVKVKINLHSPGDIILQILDFTQDNILPLLMCYFAVFGGKFGDYEFNSLIGIVKNIINAKYDSEKKNLELKKLAAETNLIEQQALCIKLDNIEKQRKMKIDALETYSEPLATASKNLDIAPSSATIVDITNIINSNKSN